MCEEKKILVTWSQKYLLRKIRGASVRGWAAGRGGVYGAKQRALPTPAPGTSAKAPGAAAVRAGADLGIRKASACAATCTVHIIMDIDVAQNNSQVLISAAY